MEEKYTIRLATPADTDGINTLYNTLYKSNRTREKFDWEFSSAPAGRSIYVIAEFKGEVIGTQCVIPYYAITAGNDTILTGKSEDTLVSPAHRGKNIFEKMYQLLIEECRKSGIQFIWGFTYATKPFLKLGFSVPYKVSMGLLALRPAASSAYFSGLSASNTFIEKLKIRLLSRASWLKGAGLRMGPGTVTLEHETVAYNTPVLNYLSEANTIGLKLDKEFLDYRVGNNPYNKQYTTINFRQNGKLLISMIYAVTRQHVGFIIHLHLDTAVTQKQLRDFLRSAIQRTELGKCHTLRFWGFTHTAQNRREVELLNAAGFTFIKRGISFVWLDLQDTKRFQPEQFVLSRMASQGTD